MQTITISGPIDEGTSARVAESLRLMDPALPIELTLDSDGGSVQAGIAIFNALQAWPAGVDVKVTGWALSVASLVAMSGRTRRVHEAGVFMIHAPWLSPGPGNAEQLRSLADALDVAGEAMLTAYRRTAQPDAVIRGWLDGRDHWFTASEGLAAGLATEVIGPAAQAATFSNFQARAAGLPSHIRSQATMTTTTHDPAAVQAGTRIEAARRDGIRRHFARYLGVEGMPELLTQCESDLTMTPEAAGLKVLAALGAQASPIMGGNFRHRESSDRVADFRAAAIDTMLMRAGLKIAEPHPASRDLQRYSLADIAESLLSMTGRTPTARGRDAVITAALGTSDFPSLLSGTANKALSMGYMTAPMQHAMWTGETEVADFKPATLANLSEAPGLLQVPELAEYKHGALLDSAAPFQLATFGRLLTISRQALVNDDLQAFTRIPQMMGVAARRLEADKCFGVLTSNPTLADGQPLFHASHGNLGTAAALSAAALAIARATMRQQKGLAGEDFIDPQPAYLIVPVALETLAEQIVASTVDPTASNATPQPEFIRRLQVVADPRLDVDSASAWYLAASPNQMDTVTRAYLAGQPRPFLDESAEFARDAISYKVRLDLAVSVMDWKGLYRNPGV